MIVLSAATYTLQLVLSAGTADVDVSYVDRTATAYPIGATQQTAATATTQTICAAPAASTSREIDFLSVKIKTTGGVVTVQKLNSSGSVTTQLISVTLLDEECLTYTHGSGWAALDANGNRKEVTSSIFSSITDTGLTSGRVVYAGTSGLLQDSANLTFNGTTLTANTIGAFILSGNITQSGNPSINIGTGALTAGATSVTTLTASGVVSVTDATDASSTTAASLKTAGGLAVVKSVIIGGSMNVAAATTGQSFIAADGGAYIFSVNVGGTGNGLGYTTGQAYFDNAGRSFYFGSGATAYATITSAGLNNTVIGATTAAAATVTTLKTSGYTVGTLPAGTTGMRAYVTDATAPAYNTALTGGGAVTVPVFYNGAAWVSA